MTAWLHQALDVPEILEGLGYAGDELAHTTLWIWHSVMSAINVAIRSAALPEGLAREELEQLESTPAAHAALIDKAVRGEDFSRIFFGFQVDKVISGIRCLGSPSA